MTTSTGGLLRAHVRSLTVRGSRTRVLDVGTGPVVLCSSGVASALWDWAPLVALLRRGFRVIVVDRPGYAPGDEVPPQLPELAEEAEHLLAALDACDVTGPVTAVGHSYGAAVVEATARLHPERIAHLVLLDGSVPEAEGTHHGDVAARAAHAFRHRTLPWALSRRTRAVWSVIGPTVAELLVPGRRGLVRAIPGVREEARDGSPLAQTLRELAGYRSCMHQLEQLRLAAPLDRRLPVLVVAANGRIPRPGLSSWVRYVLGQARDLADEARVARRVVRRSGHFVMLDQPRAVAALVAEAAKGSTAR